MEARGNAFPRGRFNKGKSQPQWVLRVLYTFWGNEFKSKVGTFPKATEGRQNGSASVTVWPSFSPKSVTEVIWGDLQNRSVPQSLPKRFWTKWSGVWPELKEVLKISPSCYDAHPSVRTADGTRRGLPRQRAFPPGGSHVPKVFALQVTRTSSYVGHHSNCTLFLLQRMQSEICLWLCAPF